MWYVVITPIPEGDTQIHGPYQTKQMAEDFAKLKYKDAVEIIFKEEGAKAYYTDFDEYFSDWPEVRDLFQDEGYDNASYGDNDLTLVSCTRIKAEFIEPHKDSLMGMGMPHGDYDKLIAKLDGQPDHYINLES